MELHLSVHGSMQYKNQLNHSTHHDGYNFDRLKLFDAENLYLYQSFTVNQFHLRLMTNSYHS